MPDSIGIVLLAAGRGTRFGPEPKLLAALDGVPLVRRAAEAAIAARSRPVVAVFGAHAEAVEAALHGLDLVRLRNPDFAAGLSTSLRVGLDALPDRCLGAVVMLADMPRVTAAHIDRLADAFDAAERKPAAIVPVHEGRRGNPVLLNRRLLAPLLAGLTGDQGAGPLLKGRPDVLEIPGDAATCLDIDTAVALENLSRE